MRQAIAKTETVMTSKLTIAAALLLGATSVALAAPRHHHHVARYHGPAFSTGTWHNDYRGLSPNDTRRSFDYQMDMGQFSGKINAN